MIARASRSSIALLTLVTLAGCRNTGIATVDSGTRDTGLHDAIADSALRDGGDVTDARLGDAATDVHANDAVTDARSDAPASDTPDVVASDTSDVGPSDVVAMDAPIVDVPVVDAPIDVVTDTVTSCTAAGGMCVALTPTSCPPPNMVGSATMYSCGGGLGVECCLPPADAGATDAGTSAAPVCMNAGTAMEGWYAADGTLLCLVSCAGLVAQCQRVGTAAQGWYTTSGHGCPPHSQLIVHDATCM